MSIWMSRWESRMSSYMRGEVGILVRIVCSLLSGVRLLILSEGRSRVWPMVAHGGRHWNTFSLQLLLGEGGHIWVVTFKAIWRAS